LKAPRLIARPISRPRQVGGARRLRKELVRQADWRPDNNTEPIRTSETDVPVTLLGLRVQPSGDRLSTATVGTAPAGV
jgi:hypothetical protein